MRVFASGISAFLHILALSDGLDGSICDAGERICELPNFFKR